MYLKNPLFAVMLALLFYVANAVNLTGKGYGLRYEGASSCATLRPVPSCPFKSEIPVFCYDDIAGNITTIPICMNHTDIGDLNVEITLGKANCISESLSRCPAQKVKFTYKALKEEDDFFFYMDSCYFKQKSCRIHELENSDEFRLAAKTSLYQIFYKKNATSLSIQFRFGNSEYLIQGGQIYENGKLIEKSFYYLDYGLTMKNSEGRVVVTVSFISLSMDIDTEKNEATIIGSSIHGGACFTDN